MKRLYGTTSCFGVHIFKPQEVHLRIVPASKYQTKEHEVWITPERFLEITQNCSNHRAPRAGKHLETLFKALWNIKKGPEWDFLEFMNIYYNTFLKTIKKLSTIEIGNRFIRVSHIFTLCKLQLKTYNQNIVKCQKKGRGEGCWYLDIFLKLANDIFRVFWQSVSQGVHILLLSLTLCQLESQIQGNVKGLGLS